jgi:hypothetical protein
VPHPLGSHLAIDDQSEADLVTLLVEVFQAGKAMTRKQLQQIVREGHNLKLTCGWGNAFIGRHFDGVHTCRSLPQKDRRVAIPRAHLAESIPGRDDSCEREVCGTSLQFG